MISLKQFHDGYAAALGYPLDKEKRAAIDVAHDKALFVVAGPGSGKTTSLVARILKFVFVDGLEPTGIFATTFTRKAAAELRSRVLEVGFSLQERLVEAVPKKAERIDGVDINQVWTGTIDSLCQDLLTLHRPAGEDPVVPVDEYVANTLMLQHGTFGDFRFQSKSFKAFLAEISKQNLNWQPVPVMTSVLQTIVDRRSHDLLDWQAYLKHNPSQRSEKEKLDAALGAYYEELGERYLVDYASVERLTLDRLRSGALADFTDGIRAVLVDEYQDTNLLQEQLYFELAAACGGGLTVVGDDDQSLYRFRGATVELFTAFPARAASQLKIEVETAYLSTNYRSTANIVGFVEDFVANDAAYASARVESKPPLRARREAERGVPILAMFRESSEELAQSVAGLLDEVFNGGGFLLPGGEKIAVGDGGNYGDAAVLMASGQELNDRLPTLLRAELQDLKNPIPLFNPRGRPVADTELVSAIGGLLLECIDPSGEMEALAFTDRRLTEWRGCATEWISHGSPAVKRLVREWARRSRRVEGTTPAAQLLYEVVTVASPRSFDSPQDLVYLEVFTRQLEAAEQLSVNRGRVVYTRGDTKTVVKRRGQSLTRSQASVYDLITYWLNPIAAGAVGINEELLDDLPLDEVSVLTIHQAKGLEFPLVIADVGSRFKKKHHSQRHLRYPDEGGTPHALEDEFRPFTELGAPSRSGRDRAFDDLVRQYFVAFSRPRDVLVLIGLESAHPSNENIPNVAAGWTRDGTNAWASSQPWTEV